MREFVSRNAVDTRREAAISSTFTDSDGKSFFQPGPENEKLQSSNLRPSSWLSAFSTAASAYAPRLLTIYMSQTPSRYRPVNPTNAQGEAE
jgi:hypothetical protein